MIGSGSSVALPCLAALCIVALWTCSGDSAGPIAKPPAALLSISGDAQTGRVGETLALPTTVKVVDVDGNAVPGVTVAWTAIAGGGAPVSPAVTSDAGGLARTTWTLGTVAGANTLRASVAGLPEVVFGATAEPGLAARLAFDVQPIAAMAGVAITPIIQVAVRDTHGNLVTSGSTTVTLEITPGTGELGAALSGTRVRLSSGGVALFTDLSIDKAGPAPYTLRATAAGLQAATSAGFAVGAGPASQLVFTGQPTTVEAGRAISPAVQVTALDVFGNTATSFSGAITVGIGTNPSAGTLSGTTADVAIGGIVTFSTLTINRSGTGYTLAASTSGLASVTSGPFDITPAEVAALSLSTLDTTVFVTQRTALRPLVSASDAFGNVIAQPDLTLHASSGWNITADTFWTDSERRGTVTVESGPARADLSVTGILDLRNTAWTQDYVCYDSPVVIRGMEPTPIGVDSLVVLLQSDSVRYSGDPGHNSAYGTTTVQMWFTGSGRRAWKDGIVDTVQLEYELLRVVAQRPDTLVEIYVTFGNSGEPLAYQAPRPTRCSANGYRGWTPHRLNGR